MNAASMSYEGGTHLRSCGPPEPWRANYRLNQAPYGCFQYTAQCPGDGALAATAGDKWHPADTRLIACRTEAWIAECHGGHDGRSHASLRSSRWPRSSGWRRAEACSVGPGRRCPGGAADRQPGPAGSPTACRALAPARRCGRAGGCRPVRLLLAPVTDAADQLGRRGQCAAGVGHAARQPAAARLDALRRVLLHHRTAAVHADRGGARAGSRGRQPRRGDDLHTAGAADGPARQG